MRSLTIDRGNLHCGMAAGAWCSFGAGRQRSMWRRAALCRLLTRRLTKEGQLLLEFSVGQINHDGALLYSSNSPCRVDSKLRFKLRFSNLGAGRLCIGPVWLTCQTTSCNSCYAPRHITVISEFISLPQLLQLGQNIRQAATPCEKLWSAFFKQI